MMKRKYHRRSDDELIAQYESKIQHLQKKMEASEREDAVVLKDLPRLRRHLAKFSQLCMDSGRADLSNSILAFLSTFELQAKEIRVTSRD
jgi:hypothetical protein